MEMSDSSALILADLLTKLVFTDSPELMDMLKVAKSDAGILDFH